MPKNVQIYNTQSLYIGPCPATGYHFIDSQGNLSNNLTDTPLLFPILRVNQVNYSFNVPRTDIKNLGNRSIIKRAILSPPEINLSLNYWQMGLINEARIGIMGNWRTGSQVSGGFLFGAGRVCPISGLYDRKFDYSNDSTFGLPLTSRDGKNIFVAVNKNNDDFNNTDAGTPAKNTNINVIGFGNCYLNSYKTAGGINQIPNVTCDFSCSNIQVYGSGAANPIPSVNVKNFQVYSGIYFSIPNNYDGSNLPTVLIPRDITLTIKNSNKSNLDNLISDFNDVKIQSYEFNIGFTRDNLFGLNFKLPLDKPINFPVICSATFSFIPGDFITGSLSNLILKDEQYDVTIKLNYQLNQGFTGVAIQYDFLGGNFNNLSYSQNIQGYETANLSLSVPMDPEDTNKGFFISGQLGIPGGIIGEIDLELQNTKFMKLQNNNILAISLISEKLLY